MECGGRWKSMLEDLQSKFDWELRKYMEAS
jgi:hypothetical protein